MPVTHPGFPPPPNAIRAMGGRWGGDGRAPGAGMSGSHEGDITIVPVDSLEDFLSVLHVPSKVSPGELRIPHPLPTIQAAEGPRGGSRWVMKPTMERGAAGVGRLASFNFQ